MEIKRIIHAPIFKDYFNILETKFKKLFYIVIENTITSSSFVEEEAYGQFIRKVTVYDYHHPWSETDKEWLYKNFFLGSSSLNPRIKIEIMYKTIQIKIMICIEEGKRNVMFSVTTGEQSDFDELREKKLIETELFCHLI